MGRSRLLCGAGARTPAATYCQPAGAGSGAAYLARLRAYSVTAPVREPLYSSVQRVAPFASHSGCSTQLARCGPLCQRYPVVREQESKKGAVTQFCVLNATPKGVPMFMLGAGAGRVRPRRSVVSSMQLLCGAPRGRCCLPSGSANAACLRAALGAQPGVYKQGWAVAMTQCCHLSTVGDACIVICQPGAVPVQRV